MNIRHDIPVYKICWLNHAQGGMIDTYYEPESKQELTELCSSLYGEGKSFDVIGHTSNIYFLPTYHAEAVVSTRRVRSAQVCERYIQADCGVSVRRLSRTMVQQGVKGFEGLVDLPGTVAASVYGNASCYGCSINDLLISFELLQPNGSVVEMKPEDLKLSIRSSVLKRGELSGVILSVKLRKEHGDAEEIKSRAEQNHLSRLATQPPAQNNLGSIYCHPGRPTVVGYSIYAAAKVYELIGKLLRMNHGQLAAGKKAFMLRLAGAADLAPYLYSWNRFIWKDAEAHRLFGKFHRKHQLLFSNSDFEIEIKG